MLLYETEARDSGFSFVIGVDEAGRGPIAGPVVAAAVALRTHQFSSAIQDSKKLSAARRETAFVEIFENAWVGIGVMNESIIDQINILQATFRAMNTAVAQLLRQLPKPPDRKNACLLIDGNRFKSEHPLPFKTIVRGDSSSLSIASASIVAKVTRDRILKVYDRIFPQYLFAKHKGYPTQEHKQAIRQHGLSSIHRKTFQVR